MSREDHYSRGLGLYQQGRYAEALMELQSVGQGEALSHRLGRFYQSMSYRQLGLAALREGQYARAEKHLRSAVELSGSCGDLTEFLQSFSMSAGVDRHRAKELERAAEKQSDNADCWRRLALAQWRAGRRPMAYMTLTEALRHSGSDGRLHLQLGLFYAAEQQYALARETFQRATEVDCTDAEAHYYLAMTAAVQGDVSPAVRSFQRAFELRPDDLMLAFQLSLAAQAADQAGDHVVLHLPEPTPRGDGSQIRQLAEYVCQEVDFLDAFLGLPPSEIDGDLFGLLAAVVQMALDAHPTYADLHCRLSKIFHRLDDVESAWEAAKKALKIHPRYTEALVHVGRMAAQADRQNEGIECLRRAIACGADRPDVHDLLDELLAQSGRQNEVRDPWQRQRHRDAEGNSAAETSPRLAA